MELEEITRELYDVWSKLEDQMWVWKERSGGITNDLLEIYPIMDNLFLLYFRLYKLTEKMAGDNNR